MRKTVFMLLAVFFCVSMFSAPVLSQDAETPVYTTAGVPAPEGAITESQFTYGTIVSASAESITISEYDFETDTSADMTYDVAADVKLENIASMKDLKQGDEVELEFVMGDGKRTVISIYVE